MFLDFFPKNYLYYRCRDTKTTPLQGERKMQFYSSSLGEAWDKESYRSKADAFYLPATMRRNIAAAYDYCQANSSNAAKVNTMSIFFDFENSKGYVLQPKRDTWSNNPIEKTNFKWEA